MTATVYKDGTSGFHRAVCKDDACRAKNAQRNYWRSPHMREPSAKVMASEHNRQHHPGASA